VPAYPTMRYHRPPLRPPYCSPLSSSSSAGTASFSESRSWSSASVIHADATPNKCGLPLAAHSTLQLLPSFSRDSTVPYSQTLRSCSPTVAPESAGAGAPSQPLNWRPLWPSLLALLAHRHPAAAALRSSSAATHAENASGRVCGKLQQSDTIPSDASNTLSADPSATHQRLRQRISQRNGNGGSSGKRRDGKLASSTFERTTAADNLEQ